MRHSEGLAEPPEGAISGDSVPRENEADEEWRMKVEELVGILKTREPYHGRSDAELREIAREKYMEGL